MTQRPMTQRQRLLKAFGRFKRHFAAQPRKPRRMMIDQAPSIVPDFI